MMRCGERDYVSHGEKKKNKSTVKFNLIFVVYHLVLKSVSVNTTGTEIMEDLTLFPYNKKVSIKIISIHPEGLV